MLANKRLSHYPPASWPCWSEAGKKGAAASNLGLGPLAGFITQFMEDPGPSNAHCGHRRWVLYSRAAKFGFGRRLIRRTIPLRQRRCMSRAAAGLPPQYPPSSLGRRPGMCRRRWFFPEVRFPCRLPLPGRISERPHHDAERGWGNNPSEEKPLQSIRGQGHYVEILPAVADIAVFGSSGNNIPITVRIDGITVDGTMKNWKYSFTMVAPQNWSDRTFIRKRLSGIPPQGA